MIKTWKFQEKFEISEENGRIFFTYDWANLVKNVVFPLDSLEI